MPAFALEPHGEDGSDTDPVSCPGAAASCGLEGVGVEGVAVVCDIPSNGKEGVKVVTAAGYSKYPGKCHDGGAL
jgi:hypothetical protein